MGVKSLYVFGSAVRVDQRPESDVDLFFDYDAGTIGIYELMDIKDAAALSANRRDRLVLESNFEIIRSQSPPA